MLLPSLPFSDSAPLYIRAAALFDGQQLHEDAMLLVKEQRIIGIYHYQKDEET